MFQPASDALGFEDYVGSKQRAMQWAMSQNMVPTEALPASLSPSVFESMLGGSVACTPVYQDDVCAAIVDGNPQAPFHIVVFPIEKHTLTRLSQYSVQHHDTLVGHLVLVGKTIAQQRGHENGIRVVINDGLGAGQQIPHLAVHILAGRQFGWPPG